MGRSVDEIKDLLEHFEWNWHLAADYLECENVDELREAFFQYQPKPEAVLNTPDIFSSAKIRPEDVMRLQNFTKERLKDALPVLLDDELSKEKRAEIASEILLSFDFGLSYKLLHADDLQDAYTTLEDEAIALERWREQDLYLTVVEETLFRIAAKLEREQREEDEAAQSQIPDIADELEDE